MEATFRLNIVQSTAKRWKGQKQLLQLAMKLTAAPRPIWQDGAGRGGVARAKGRGLDRHPCREHLALQMTQVPESECLVL